MTTTADTLSEQLDQFGADAIGLVETVTERRDTALDALRAQKGWMERLVREELKYRTTGQDPKLNGYAYAEIPDWALLQRIEAIDEAIAASEPGKAVA